MRNTRARALRREFKLKFGRAPRKATKVTRGHGKYYDWFTVSGNEFRPVKKAYVRGER
jgi:hypothetical protein